MLRRKRWFLKNLRLMTHRNSKSNLQISGFCGARHQLTWEASCSNLMKLRMLVIRWHSDAASPSTINRRNRNELSKFSESSNPLTTDIAKRCRNMVANWVLILSWIAIPSMTGHYRNQREFLRQQTKRLSIWRSKKSHTGRNYLIASLRKESSSVMLSRCIS